jgi:hypothetical protein
VSEKRLNGTPPVFVGYGLYSTADLGDSDIKNHTPDRPLSKLQNGIANVLKITNPALLKIALTFY